MASPGHVSLDELKSAIYDTPMIDHHAHLLLGPLGEARDFKGEHPLLSPITEPAREGAIHLTPSTLGYSRAKRQLAARLDCEPALVSATLSEQALFTDQQRKWTTGCLAGFQTILVDDSPTTRDSKMKLCGVEDLSTYTRSGCRRIVRIDAVVDRLISRHVQEHTADTDPTAVFDSVVASFDAEMTRLLTLDDVAGFKSMLSSHRGGLDDPGHQGRAELLEEFRSRIYPKGRLREPPSASFYSLFVWQAGQRIAASPAAKPIQFRVGLGDGDATLTKASPAALLQPFIEAFPDVPIVLLHAGWPFAREAAYLASTYPNVHVDVGEAFPGQSRDGQERALKELLEAAPWTKILGGTDGQLYPETYWLAEKQLRDALCKVLGDYGLAGDMTWQDTIAAAQAILFNNCNALYGLGLPENGNGPTSSTDLAVTHGTPIPSSVAGSELSANYLLTMQTFLSKHPEIEYIGVYFVDMCALQRMRSISVHRVLEMLRQDPASPITMSFTQAILGLMQDDRIIGSINASGAYLYAADHQSLMLGPWPNYASVRGNFRTLAGASVPYCARTALERVVEAARRLGLEFRVGFELELVFMRIGPDGSFLRLDSPGHAWARPSAMDHPVARKVLEPTIRRLEAAGIEIEMIHPESAPGQYEIVLRHLPPVEAVDRLMHVRLAIGAAATAEGYHATLHPKPFDGVAGTASHVHMSISSRGGNSPAVYERFYAGVLDSLQAVSAFTLAHPTSYKRAVDGAWSGGTWVAWGTQNREAPLRKVEDSHWEIRPFDGTANAYLGLAAVLAAGTVGYRDKAELKMKDMQEAATDLSGAERQALGVWEKMPDSLPSALGYLRSHAGDRLRELMGTQTVERYIEIKEREMADWDGVAEQDRWEWVVARY